MNQNTMRRGHVLLLAVVTILVAFAGSAAATRAITDEPKTPQGGLQYVTEPVSVPAISKVTATARCPSGTRAIDGGLTSDSLPFTRVDASAATDDGSGWRVVVLNQHPNEPISAHLWVGCISVR